MLLGGLLASQAFAGGVNVWDEEIYTDGVTLTDWTGAPLDINGDGHADLAIAGYLGTAGNRSRYYLGKGDGTFNAPVLLTQGSSSVIGAADLNGDGLVDLLHAGRDVTSLLYFNNGAGGVGGEIDLSTETNRSLSVAFGDLDLDGDIDIVVGNGRANGSTNPAIAAQTNRFYLNDFTQTGAINPTFAGDDISADLDVTRSIALVDMDGDGHLDVVSVSDSTTNLNASMVYRNLFGDNGGTVAFAPGVEFGLVDDQTTKALVGDLNNDGRPDIVQLNFGDVNRFFINNSSAGTVDIGTGVDISADTDRTNGGVLADFDGDGDLDLAVANFRATVGTQSSRNRLYLNQFIETGDVSFAAALDISADEHETHQLAATDLNDDGHIDIVVGNQSGIGGVAGFDRRYLNNGTDDPFTNIAPIIDSQVALGTATDVPLELLLDHLNVTDPDNAYPADFTLTVQTGANYNLTDNTITPTGGFIGVLTVPVIVNDGTEDSEPFDVSVAVGAPFFTSTPVEDATEGTVYTYDVVATDPDGGLVTITAPVLSTWLTLTDHGDGTATLTGTPTQEDVGDHNITLQVSDGGVVPGVQEFVIAVANVNDAPAFTSTPVTDATEGAAYAYDVETSDADGSDTLTITAPTLPAWLTLADNGDGTASLTGTPGAADVGNHPVSLQVSDETETVLQDFTVVVAAAPAGNTPPTFTSSAITAATVETAYTYNVTTADADDDPLDITAATALPGWLTLTDNDDGTATLTGTPAAGDAGNHAISLQVSDGTATAQQNFTIIVSATPPANNVPTISTTAVITATEGTTYTYDITATDADAGATLVITAPTLPAWLELMDNGDGTAALTGTPDASDVGTHPVSIQVSDGSDTAAQDFTITVEAAAVTPPPPPPPSGGGGGGGSFGLMSLFALCAVGAFRRRRWMV